MTYHAARSLGEIPSGGLTVTVNRTVTVDDKVYTYRLLAPAALPLFLQSAALINADTPVEGGGSSDKVIITQAKGPTGNFGQWIQKERDKGFAIVLADAGNPGIAFAYGTRDIELVARLMASSPQNHVLIEPTAGWVSGLAAAFASGGTGTGWWVLGALGVAGASVYFYSRRKKAA